MTTLHKLTFLATMLLLLSTAAWGQTGWNTSDAVTATNGTTYTLGSTVVNRTMNVPDNVTVTITNATSGTTLENSSNTITLNLQGSNSRVNWDAKVSGNNTSNGVVNITGSSGDFYVRSGSSIENTGSGRAITTSSGTTLRVQGGTISASGSYTIYAWYGNISVSSGTISNTGSGYTIISGSLEMSGGTIRANTGIAIYPYGTVTVSGGTVEATGESTGARAIYTGYSYNVTISGSANVRVNSGIAISAGSGSVNVNGGTVEATNSSSATYAIEAGSVTVSGGTIRTASTSTSSRAIYSSGNITVSSGTVRVNNGIAIYAGGSNSTATVSGGNVEATGSDATTRAIYSYYSSTALSITGGTVSMTNSSPNGLAIEASGDVNLGNSPTITGRIRTGYNRLSPRTQSPVFSPASGRTYTLDPSTYSTGQIAVTYGASFINNFRLYNTEYALMAEDDNLIVTRNISSAAITVTAPVLDATRSTNASKVTSSDNYSISSVTWTPTPTDNKFQPNTAYTVQATLAANTGYTFQGLASATINGQSASISNNTGTAVALSYTFSATARYTGSGSVSIDDWIFGGTPSEPILDTDIIEYSTPKIEYSAREMNSWSTQVPTNAGEYTIMATWEQTASYYKHEATYDFIIEKAVGDFVPPFNEDLEVTYNPTWTLGSIMLPSGYDWAADVSTPLSIGNGQKIEVIYIYSDGNLYAIDEITVNVVAPENAEIPIITMQPESIWVLINETHTISAFANVNDGGTLSYQWYSNTTASNIDGSIIEGATSSSYTPPSSNTISFLYYYFVVTNTNNYATGNKTATITSEVSMLTVGQIEISNAEELREFATAVNGGTNYSGNIIILTNDIELSEAWTPIGNGSTRSFQGIFDGQGYTISGLSVSGFQYAGLFGYVGENGQIKNVNVVATQIRISTTTTTTQNFYAGGLAGYYASSMPIENSSVKADSIVSRPSSSYTYSSYSGGLVGYSSDTLIISNSYATGNVSASALNSSYSGGLVGYAYATLTISNSYATGNVSASTASNSFSGGLVGYAASTLTIENSYATGNVSSSASNFSYSGGLVGYVSTYNISYSYASGTITATGGTYNHSGGIFGRYSSGTITSVYYNSAGTNQASGYNSGSIVGITALSSEDMKKKASFVGWDFYEIWGIKEGETYPYLRTTYAIQPIANQIYTGSQIEPELSIYKKNDGTVLTKDKDYTLTYGTNINVGTGTINIIGQGDYADLQENVTFIILKTSQTAPSAPTMASRTSTSITLNEISSAEYRLGEDGAWQDEVEFTNLEPDKTYLFYARLKETATQEASEASDASEISTLPIYTVTFVDHDGTVLKTEDVEHGTSATNPVAPERDGYIFDGWDVEFNEVTDHLTVTATYKDDPTPILLPQIVIGQISVKAINDGILLENLPSNTKVELFNLQGKQVYLGNSGNSQILQILIQTKGVYIVKVGSKTFKVVK